MTDKLDQALKVLGLAPGDVDPAVLAGLRKAATDGPKQMDRSELAGRSPEEITQLKNEGRLDAILGRR